MRSLLRRCETLPSFFRAAVPDLDPRAKSQEESSDRDERDEHLDGDAQLMVKLLPTFTGPPPNEGI
jgi:hypothetical protein